MKLTEDVSKRLLRDLGLPVPDGAAATSPDEARAQAVALGGAVAVKALIPTGRRGKAGLVRLADDADAAADAAADMLGRTTEAGTVERVYVERRIEFADELYLAFSFADRAPQVVLSREGGVEIEAVHRDMPERIVTAEIDPVRGLRPWEAIDLWSRAGLSGRALAQAGRLTARLYDAFVQLDGLMLELNPVALDSTGRCSLIGAMLETDDDALDRQPALADAPDRLPANPRERAVSEANRAYPGGDSRYVELDGEIGLLVAGGGAGLLQHDLIVDMGGRPANHSDMSPAPGTEKLEAVLDAVFTNPRARSLLIGYNYLQMAPCDRVAEALLKSVRRNAVDARRFPIVLRLVGPKEARAREIVAGIEGAIYLPHEASLADGCRTIVEVTRALDGGEGRALG